MILRNLGWISVVLGFGFFPVFLGAVAVCMGVVLRRDYGEEKQGRNLIVMGVVSAICGWAINIYLLK